MDLTKTFIVNKNLKKIVFGYSPNNFSRHTGCCMSSCYGGSEHCTSVPPSSAKPASPLPGR